MHKNIFPDSEPKRALRIRDKKKIMAFSKSLNRKLDYCGLPSIEFLDIIEWRESINKVVAVEYNEDNAKKMETNILNMEELSDLVIDINNQDIFDFLLSGNHFDLYNIDLYGGLHYGTSKSINAFKSVFKHQSESKRSFILITTFNVRDKGATEYITLLSNIHTLLQNYENIDENLNAHKKNQAHRLKACFTYFCWNESVENNFSHTYQIYKYSSSSSMVHLHQQFNYEGNNPLFRDPSLNGLINILNEPIYEMINQIPKRIEFPQISPQ